MQTLPAVLGKCHEQWCDSVASLPEQVMRMVGPLHRDLSVEQAWVNGEIEGDVASALVLDAIPSQTRTRLRATRAVVHDASLDTYALTGPTDQGTTAADSTAEL